MTDIKQLMLDLASLKTAARRWQRLVSEQKTQIARLTHKLELIVLETIGRRKLLLAVLDWDKETGQLPDGLRRAIRDDIALSCAHDKASKRAA